VVDQIVDLFHTTHTVKTRHVTIIRGRYCRDIELVAYLANAAGPMSLVRDLHIDHDRFGSSADPSLNGHLHYPNDIDKSFNEVDTDKIRKYRSDYNKTPHTSVSFMPAVASTSGRLHSEFVRLQAHWETDRFFAASGVHAQTVRDQFHFLRTTFSSHLKSRVGLVLTKATVLRIMLNIDGAPITSKSHTSLFFSLASHKHSDIGFIFSSRFIVS
jgi:hypothetical protein